MATYGRGIAEIDFFPRLADPSGPPHGDGKSLGQTVSAPRRKASATWLVLLLVIGCSSASHDQIIGQWVGRPTEGPNANDSNGQHRSAKPRFEFLLEFPNNRQFSMTLRDDQGRADERSGRYRVIRSRGSRWEIVLNSENLDQSVTLELAFQNDHRMVVREVAGDSRLSRYTFERVTSGASSGVGTSALQEKRSLPES